jgi:hypothetical protein
MSAYNSRRGGARTQVFLNVYDLSPHNGYIYPWGLGFYHSGIEVYGKEWSFGGGAGGGDGVFEAPPRNAGSNVEFREQILLGETQMSSSDVDYEISKLRPDFRSDQYHVVKKNCNVFSNSLSVALLKTPIPGWVNRMAVMGNVCGCFMPTQTPNGQATYSRSELSAAGARSGGGASRFKAFGGSGQSLLATQSASSASSSSAAESDPRRDAARNAALARIAKAAGDDDSSAPASASATSSSPSASASS